MPSTFLLIAKLSPQELQLKQEFEAFEGETQIMLHLLEFWDRKACVSLKVRISQ